MNLDIVISPSGGLRRPPLAETLHGAFLEYSAVWPAVATRLARGRSARPSGGRPAAGAARPAAGSREPMRFRGVPRYRWGENLTAGSAHESREQSGRLDCPESVHRP